MFVFRLWKATSGGSLTSWCEVEEVSSAVHFPFGDENFLVAVCLNLLDAFHIISFPVDQSLSALYNRSLSLPRCDRLAGPRKFEYSCL